MRLAWSLGVACVAVMVLLFAAPQPVPARSMPSPAGLPDAVAQASDTPGAVLFHRSCASCHGERGQGTEFGPSLVNAGAAAADFMLRTGRMPFTNALDTQPQRKPPAFNDEQIRELVAFVASLGDGPKIPEVVTDDALVPRGQAIFVGNCAPCHGATANGGAVGGGAIAPALDRATPVQVVEAMIIGPGQMPVFSYPDEDEDGVASYVEYLQTSGHPGGFSIGGIGPVPEGFVGWVLGMGLLLAIVYLIGRKWHHTTAQADGEIEQGEAQ